MWNTPFDSPDRSSCRRTFRLSPTGRPRMMSLLGWCRRSRSAVARSFRSLMTSTSASNRKGTSSLCFAEAEFTDGSIGLAEQAFGDDGSCRLLDGQDCYVIRHLGGLTGRFMLPSKSVCGINTNSNTGGSVLVSAAKVKVSQPVTETLQASMSPAFAIYAAPQPVPILGDRQSTAKPPRQSLFQDDEKPPRSYVVHQSSLKPLNHF
jgi:hypothetical protein